MKNILIVIMTLISTISFAGACQHSEENLICPGDDVVVVDDDLVDFQPIRQAQILGVNAKKNEVVYKWFGRPISGYVEIDHTIHTSGWWNSTTSTKKISVKYGCISGVCVNDEVIYSNMIAKVLAVSPYTQKVIISTTRALYQVDPSDLASRVQCVDYSPEARSAKFYLKK